MLWRNKLHLTLQEIESLNSFQIITNHKWKTDTPTTATTNMIFQLPTSQAGYYDIIKCRTAPHCKVPYKGCAKMTFNSEEEEERHWKEAANIAILPILWKIHPTRKSLDSHSHIPRCLDSHIPQLSQYDFNVIRNLHTHCREQHWN